MEKIIIRIIEAGLADFRGARGGESKGA